MSVTNIEKDHEALVMTITAEIGAPLDRAWHLWADPRQLERWWGPPTFPATFVDHDLTPGAVASYFMTGPDGTRHHGWWRVLAVDAPCQLRLEDGFADEAGNPVQDMPVMTIGVRLDEIPEGGTRMSIETQFPSRDSMDEIISMGVEEGMTLAIAQIDEILDADVSRS